MSITRSATRGLALLTISAAAMSAAFATPAGAVTPVDPANCRGTIGAITVDEVTVPANATCTLKGTIVLGDVKAGTNSVLNASSVRVEGNVQLERARSARLTTASRILGDVQVKQGGRLVVTDSTITGSFEFEENTGTLSLLRNRVGGDVKVDKNRAATTIRANRITNNLQCVENVPAPVGGANIVGGTKDGQCATL